MKLVLFNNNLLWKRITH